MAKLKNIVRQLSLTDYQAIYGCLMSGSAEKSAYLLKFMREKQFSDTKIMQHLEVNPNAYYTLRSRLNQKIEEYLLQQIENPRTDLLKKVANISEIIFTKKRTIAIAILKKLEKELIDYDFSNELTTIYKILMKLHINSDEHFTYSQLYNKHVAYTLAVDKAENLLAQYFKKYGFYNLTGGEREKLEIILLNREINNVCKLYKSHRLYVYQSCCNIFHRLFVDNSENTFSETEPVEEILMQVEKIFEQYYLDSLYFNIKLVFEFLKLEYYSHYKIFRKSEKYYHEINEQVNLFFSSYNLFTYPPQFLVTKLQRSYRTNTETELYEENKVLFADYESNSCDIASHTIYYSYRAISCFYAKKYDEAIRYLNNLQSEINTKKGFYAQIEIKTLLALQYYMIENQDALNQTINGVQRQLRLSESESNEHIQVFIKILKSGSLENKTLKLAKIKAYLERLRGMNISHYSPIMSLNLSDDFIKII